MKLKLALLFLMLPFVAYAQFEPAQVIITDGLDNIQLKTAIEQNISLFLTECNEAVMKGGKPVTGKVMSPDAKSAFGEMWKSSPMACTSAKIEEICIKTSSGYQVRNIPVYMVGADEDKKRQEIVIDLTASGLIDNVTIAIEANQYKEIIDEHESVEDLYRRQIIVEFVENYRTSYNRKDLEYIGSVFSDNALIITGKVIREKPKSDDMMQSLGHERVVYQKRSKAEYIENLEKVFSRSKYINVTFEEVEVIQHPRLTDIYGVTLKQKWNTDVYSDAGFVFLMIDFHDELHPMIQVRTWQPEKVNNKILPREEVFHLGDFKIVRSL